MYENIGDGVVASDMHVGIQPVQSIADDDAPCPPGSPAGRPVSFGVRVTGIPAGVTAVITITISKRTRLSCVSLPPLLAPLFTVTGLKVGDIENIVTGSATVLPAPAVLGPLGVDGTEFLPYSTCANMVSGQCMDMGEPLVFSAVNNSGVAATLPLSVHGKTVAREQIR